MMDVYFEPGGDSLSLDEMLAGDIKANFELCLTNPLDGSDDTSGEEFCYSPVEWSSASLHSSLHLDLCGDPAAGIMVNPNSVMPVIKRESEKLASQPQLRVKREEDSQSEPSDDEEEEEEEEEVKLKQEIESSHEEEEIIVPDPIHRSSIWNTLITRPAKVVEPAPKQRVIIKTEPITTTITPTANSTNIIQSQPKEAQPAPIHIQAGKQKKLVQEYGGTSLEEYPKPAYSYSCLIAMALKNSATGSLPVSEIYNFMCEHFPYFKSAPSGWKNSVRHNLSLNKCFEKIEKVSPASGGSQRKGCLWAMNPAKITKMDDEVAKWSRKDPQAIRRAMRFPETLEKLERGDMKIGSKSEVEDEESESESNHSSQVSEEEEEEEDPGTEDEGEVPPSLKPFDSRLNKSLVVSESIPNDLGVELSDDMYEELGLLQQVLTSNGEDDFDLYGIGGTPSKKAKLSSSKGTVQVIQRHAISSRQ